MNLTKRLSFTLLLVFLAANVFAQPLQVKINPRPHIDDPAILLAIERLQEDLNADLPNIDIFPEGLVRGLADAAVFANHGASQRAFGGYDFLNISIGTMLGIRMPAISELSNISEADDFMEEISSIPFGFNIQALNLEAGINASKFLPLDKLYLGARFGFTSISSDSAILSAFMSEDMPTFDFSTFQIGAIAKYQLLKGFDLPLIKWRGIIAGSGILYQRTSLGINYPLEDLDEGDVVFRNPAVTFDMVINTVTIPLEINTAIQLLIFNLSAGVGADLAFGNNNMDIGIGGQVWHDSEGTVADAALNAGGSKGPSLLNPKLMANLGFKFGPVFIDVPITYYFTGGMGVSLGFTIGAAF